jgi:hypothetical protein
MWGVDIDPEQPFVYSIFGIQYTQENPTETQQTRINKFHSLIHPAAPYIDNIIQDDPSSGSKTRIWLAYWKSLPSYKEWWEGKEVVDFWSSLPADAGMWRETMIISRGRTQSGLAAPKPEGMAYVGKVIPRTTAEGYWGCYRDRYEENSKTNRLNSSLEAPPEPKKSSKEIRSGRVLMTTFPENLCFVVEGQDHSSISDEEKTHWFENFDNSVTNWINDLANADQSAGILNTRLCYAPENGTYRHSTPEALNYNRKIQLFYFLDHGYMERIGVRNKGHVALRNNFLASYCPAGAMGKIAKLMLWVETSVVKSDEIECEYVGCLEGTGLLKFDHLDAFKSASDAPTAGWMSSLKGWIPFSS